MAHIGFMSASSLSLASMIVFLLLTMNIDSTNAQTSACFYGFSGSDTTKMVKVCPRADVLDSDTGDDNVNDTAIAIATGFQYTVFLESISMGDVFGSAADLDFFWVLWATFLVFFMQTGFTLLEAGMVKHTNVQNIVFKNIMDTCISGITFYLFGFCIAFGDDDSKYANGFIGTQNLVLESKEYNFYFFQWAFSTTAATIISGSVAERCTLPAYFVYTAWLSFWMYPIVVHWMWSGTGWMSPFNVTNDGPEVDGGVIDFAGSGVVHMVGGFSGLMGAIALGPRLGRFAKDSSRELQELFEKGHSVPFQVLGTFILWFGWYGFNPGSTLMATGGASVLAGKVAVNTTLSAGMGGLTVGVLVRILPFGHRHWSVPAMCNGILAGLVSITSACVLVTPWASIFIGLIGGCVYYVVAELVALCKVDDPLDAFAVHASGGSWGLLSVGVFGWNKENIMRAGFSEEVASISQGRRFGNQLMAIAVIAVWTIVCSGMLFGILRCADILRVEDSVELQGMDIPEHGGKGRSYAPGYSVRAKKFVALPQDFDFADDDADGGRSGYHVGVVDEEEEEEDNADAVDVIYDHD